MSAEDYRKAEKLFGGTWEIMKMDMEDFLTAGGKNFLFIFTGEEYDSGVLARATESFLMRSRAFFLNEKIIHLSRVGNSIHYKTSVGVADVEFVIKLNEVTEWKEKEVDPVFDFKTIALTFKDGVWTQETTPVKPNSGKRYRVAVTVQDGMLHSDFSLPDDPHVRGSEVFKKCE